MQLKFFLFIWVNAMILCVLFQILSKIFKMNFDPKMYIAISILCVACFLFVIFIMVPVSDFLLK